MLGIFLLRVCVWRVYSNRPISSLSFSLHRKRSNLQSSIGTDNSSNIAFTSAVKPSFRSEMGRLGPIQVCFDCPGLLAFLELKTPKRVKFQATHQKRNSNFLTLNKTQSDFDASLITLNVHNTLKTTFTQLLASLEKVSNFTQPLNSSLLRS